MNEEEQIGAVEPTAERAEIARLKSELRQEEQRALRALADFENYRRRVERERAGAAEQEKRKLLLVLLELADDFERALAHVKDSPKTVAEGLHALQRRLLQVLEAEGVRSFESIGHSFDPAVHEALGTVRSDRQEPGTVLDELSRGYHWRDEVLRPARVRVVEDNG
jgi:molecular chaperone GrpE